MAGCGGAGQLRTRLSLLVKKKLHQRSLCTYERYKGHSGYRADQTFVNLKPLPASQATFFCHAGYAKNEDTIKESGLVLRRGLNRRSRLGVFLHVLEWTSPWTQGNLKTDNVKNKSNVQGTVVGFRAMMRSTSGACSTRNTSPPTAARSVVIRSPESAW